MFSSTLLRTIEQLQGSKTPFCLSTVVDARGSIPQVVGAKALFTSNGLLTGTVGGGRIETWAGQTAAELLAGDPTVRTCFRRLNLQKDIGMTCAGEMTMYLEVYRPEAEWNIVVFGAGHVSQKLCRFLIELDCRVTCFDTREEWLSRLPQAANFQSCHVNAFADGVPAIPENATVIVMTMGHSTDKPLLHAIAASNKPLAFLGAIGSDAKARTMRRELVAEGLTKEFVDSIVCPVGDKVGDNTPAEIAVGVISQLVRLRHAQETPCPHSR